MRRFVTAAVVGASLLASACGDSGFNAGCKEYCVTVAITANESEAEIGAALKKACEELGRHGTPQVLHRSKDQIEATCGG
jgi:hypothetical protein